MKRSLLAILSIVVILFNSCNRNKKIELSGAGATFPLPYYNYIFKQFNNSQGITVSYGGIGSGGGIRSLKDHTVDFAGSDAFLTDKEMSQMDEVIHIPTCLGAVVLAYNIPENVDLNLTGDIIADIYEGKITHWNDERIAEINPNTKLSDNKINVVYRSDGSGTTNIFTDYLSKISPSWSKNIGSGKSVSFPIGIAAKGNPGVAGILSNTKNSIGYVSSEYAFSQNLKIAAIQNSNDEFIKPTTESISKAASSNISKDSRTMITNSPVIGAYPISCLTWIIVYKEQAYNNRNLEKAKATKTLLNFILSEKTQAETEKIHYVPLPENIRQNALTNLENIVFKGKKI